MLTIHPIQTGYVQIKASQRRRKRGGPLRVLLDRDWTDWLPIYAWAIEHPEGPIVVDTGDTARTSEPAYFPRWHPYYLTSVRFKITEDQEIGPQLKRFGIDPKDVRTVILTHLHTDHAGGLHHFPESEILVDGHDHETAKGFMGKARGYVPHRWPTWFSPTPIPFEKAPIGPFARSYSATEAGDVLVVPTPGHTPGHISVIVKSGALSYFLAGDASYTQTLLLDREPDGVSPNRSIAIETIDAILRYAQAEPTVYLPSHDPQSVQRLEQKRRLEVAA